MFNFQFSQKRNKFINKGDGPSSQIKDEQYSLFDWGY